jgi:hypothetical protein
MRQEDIEAARKGMVKACDKYRSLTGGSVPLDSLIDEATTWIRERLPAYIRHKFVREPWAFPPIDTAIYDTQLSQLRDNRLEEFLDHVGALADAMHEVDTARYRRRGATIREAVGNTLLSYSELLLGHGVTPCCCK